MVGVCKYMGLTMFDILRNMAQHVSFDIPQNVSFNIPYYLPFDIPPNA